MCYCIVTVIVLSSDEAAGVFKTYNDWMENALDFIICIALQGPVSEHYCSCHWPDCLRMLKKDDLLTKKKDTNTRAHTHTTRTIMYIQYYTAYACNNIHIYIHIYIYIILYLREHENIIYDKERHLPAKDHTNPGSPCTARPIPSFAIRSFRKVGELGWREHELSPRLQTQSFELRLWAQADMGASLD